MVLKAVAPKDPLIVDGDRLDLLSWQSSGVKFDLDGNGTSESTHTATKEIFHTIKNKFYKMKGTHFLNKHYLSNLSKNS